jgi:hypothetical protein
MSNDDFNDDLETPTEADLDACYGSKYLGAVDIGDKKIRTRIGKIRKETMPERDGKIKRPKFVLYFTTLEKPMVLNTTNKEALIDKLGKKPADWKGAEVGLFTVLTQFAGKPTKGLRLTVLSVSKAAPPAPQPAPEPTPKPALKPTPKQVAKATTAEEPMPGWDPEDPGFRGDDADFNEAAE